MPVEVAGDDPQSGICQSDRQPGATVLMALLLTSLPGLMERILRVPRWRNFSCLFTDRQLLSLLCVHIKLSGLFFGGGWELLTFINLSHKNIFSATTSAGGAGRCFVFQTASAARVLVVFVCAEDK